MVIPEILTKSSVVLAPPMGWIQDISTVPRLSMANSSKVVVQKASGMLIALSRALRA